MRTECSIAFPVQKPCTGTSGIQIKANLVNISSGKLVGSIVHATENKRNLNILSCQLANNVVHSFKENIFTQPYVDY